MKKGGAGISTPRRPRSAAPTADLFALRIGAPRADISRMKTLNHGNGGRKILVSVDHQWAVRAKPTTPYRQGGDI